MKCSIIDRCILAAAVLVLLFASGCGGSGTHPIPMNQLDQIVFTSNRALDGSDRVNGDSNIWVMNSDGTEVKPLTRLTALGAHSDWPVWSPDGTQIAYRSSRALDGSDATVPGTWTANIWVMNSDGTGAKPLTKITSDYMSSADPRWSPAGDKILFSASQPPENTVTGTPLSTRTYPGNIWMINADGTNARPLTRLTPASSGSPQWSPDGTKVLYGSNRPLDLSSYPPNPTTNIWVMNADGTDTTPLTTHIAAPNYSAVWSPDGKTIMYNSNQALDGGDTVLPAENIWTMNSDGWDERPLTKFTAKWMMAFEPVWSPDGTRIAFVCNLALDGNTETVGAWNIWTVNADGTDAQPLTRLTVAQSESPAWSNDGRRIAFDSDRALDGTDTTNGDLPAYNIWVMNADGSGATPLTKSSARGTYSSQPQWRP